MDFAEWNVGRRVLRKEYRFLAPCHQCAATHNGSVVGAVVVLLYRKFCTRVHGNPLYPVAFARIDAVVFTSRSYYIVLAV
mgnify:CR=1 FL=1